MNKPLLLESIQALIPADRLQRIKDNMRERVLKRNKLEQDALEEMLTVQHHFGG